MEALMQQIEPQGPAADEEFPYLRVERDNPFPVFRQINAEDLPCISMPERVFCIPHTCSFLTRATRLCNPTKAHRCGTLIFECSTLGQRTKAVNALSDCRHSDGSGICFMPHLFY